MDNCPFYPYNMHVSFSMMKLFIQISEGKKKRKKIRVASWRFKGGNAEMGQLETAKQECLGVWTVNWRGKLCGEVRT